MCPNRLGQWKVAYMQCLLCFSIFRQYPSLSLSPSVWKCEAIESLLCSEGRKLPSCETGLYDSLFKGVGVVDFSSPPSAISFGSRCYFFVSIIKNSALVIPNHWDRAEWTLWPLTRAVVPIQWSLGEWEEHIDDVIFVLLQVSHGDLTLYVIASNEAEQQEWISLIRQCKCLHTHSIVCTALRSYLEVMRFEWLWVFLSPCEFAIYVWLKSFLECLVASMCVFWNCMAHE